MIVKNIIENVTENAISSSKTISLVLKSLQTLAVELKKLADVAVKLNERLDAHEKIIIEICNIQAENAGNLDPDIMKIGKHTSKPN